jgi:hypothetical protein
VTSGHLRLGTGFVGFTLVLRSHATNRAFIDQGATSAVPVSTDGLRFSAGGHGRDENRRLTFRALNSLVVQQFIADDDFMTVRTFKFDRVHDARPQ